MDELGEIFTVLGIGAIALGIIAIIAFAIGFIAAIVLLCLSIKEKGELKVKGIDENRIRKIANLAIWSLVVTIISCSGCALLVLPILALVFINSNAKTALKSGDVVEAAKKADLSLLMLIISNAIILGLSALGTIGNVLSFIFELN